MGFDALLETVGEIVWPVIRRETLCFSLKAAGARSRLYAEQRIRGERVRDDGGWEVDVEMTPSQLETLYREPGVTRLQ